MCMKLRIGFISVILYSAAGQPRVVVTVTICFLPSRGGSFLFFLSGSEPTKYLRSTVLSIKVHSAFVLRFPRLSSASGLVTGQGWLSSYVNAWASRFFMCLPLPTATPTPTPCRFRCEYVCVQVCGPTHTVVRKSSAGAVFPYLFIFLETGSLTEEAGPHQLARAGIAGGYCHAWPSEWVLGI